MGNEIVPQQGLDLAPAIMAATELGKEGVDVLERLHAIQKDERAYSAKGMFVQAMNALRKAMPRITKKRSGQHGTKREGTKTRGNYAPLDDITEVLDPYCDAHGFIYDFDREVLPGREDDYIVCIVTHEGGHEKRSHYPAPAGQQNKGTNALQAVAIGESYARRYALCAAFGITTADPDEDGQSSVLDATISEEQGMELEAKVEASGADWDRFLAAYGVERLRDFPAAKYGHAIGLLNRKIKAKGAE